MNRRFATRRPAAQSGFTLIEILLVVAIIGILAAGATMKFGGKIKATRITQAKSDVKSLETAVSMYEIDHGVYPGALSALTVKDDKGGPYIKEVPKDPWGGSYTYNASDGSVGFTSQ